MLFDAFHAQEKQHIHHKDSGNIPRKLHDMRSGENRQQYVDGRHGNFRLDAEKEIRQQIEDLTAPIGDQQPQQTAQHKGERDVLFAVDFVQPVPGQEEKAGDDV